MSAHDAIQKLLLDEAEYRTQQGIPYNARGLAHWLIVNHPVEVEQFLAVAQEDLLTSQVNIVLSHQRQYSRNAVSYREPSQILRSESAGRMIYAVDQNGNRKEVAQFTKADGAYVIAMMRSRVSTQMALAQWVEYLTKDLTGNQTVADKYDEVKINAAYQRLVRK